MIEPSETPVSDGATLLEVPGNLRRYALTDVLSKRQELVQRKGIEVFASGGFQARASRDVGESELFARRSSAKIASNGGTSDLDLRYRDVGHYVID